MAFDRNSAEGCMKCHKLILDKRMRWYSFFVFTSQVQATVKTTVMIVADVNGPMFRTSTDRERNRQLARCGTIDCADIRGQGPVRSHANKGERYLPTGEAWDSDNQEG